jgi:hypothetical protein
MFADRRAGLSGVTVKQPTQIRQPSFNELSGIAKVQCQVVWPEAMDFLGGRIKFSLQV